MRHEGISLRLTCGGSLGDHLCFLSAARDFARTTGLKTAVVTPIPDVLDLYEDDLVSGSSNDRPHLLVNPEPRHRVKHASPDANYVGTFLAAMGITFTEPPSLELPTLPAVDGLPAKYAVIQPRSGFARNPCTSFVERIVEAAVQATGLPVFGVGMQTAAPPHVDCQYMRENAPQLLALIAHATFVLSPRSATAHVAAAYRIPSIIWVPSDGENWHLDYPRWTHCRLDNYDADPYVDATSFLENIRSISL